MAGMLATGAAVSVMRSAPVGVVSSPSTGPPRTSRPSRSASVTGVGTGTGPLSVSTHPPPSGRGAWNADPMPSASNSAKHPVTSNQGVHTAEFVEENLLDVHPMQSSLNLGKPPEGVGGADDARRR